MKDKLTSVWLLKWHQLSRPRQGRGSWRLWRDLAYALGDRACCSGLNNPHPPPAPLSFVTGAAPAPSSFQERIIRGYSKAMRRFFSEHNWVDRGRQLWGEKEMAVGFGNKLGTPRTWGAIPGEEEMGHAERGERHWVQSPLARSATDPGHPLASPRFPSLYASPRCVTNTLWDFPSHSQEPTPIPQKLKNGNCCQGALSHKFLTAFWPGGLPQASRSEEL